MPPAFFETFAQAAAAADGDEPNRRRLPVSASSDEFEGVALDAV